MMIVFGPWFVVAALLCMNLGFFLSGTELLLCAMVSGIVAALLDRWTVSDLIEKEDDDVD